MEGLEVFINKDPTPQCLIDEPEDLGSDSSSRLSDPFSEYAPLEEPAQDLQGQLAKFSKQFQAAMREMHPDQHCTTSSQKDSHRTEECNQFLYTSQQQQPAESCMLKLAIPDELLARSPDDDDEVGTCHSHVSSRDLSLQHGGLWSKLEQYTEFTLSVENESDEAPRCLPVPVREDALAKCAAWLEQHASPTTVIIVESPPSTPDNNKHDLVRAKWKREKNLLLALKPT